MVTAECPTHDRDLHYRSWHHAKDRDTTKDLRGVIGRLPSILIIMIAGWASKFRIEKSMAYIESFGAHKIDWGIVTYDHNDSRGFENHATHWNSLLNLGSELNTAIYLRHPFIPKNADKHCRKFKFQKLFVPLVVKNKYDFVWLADDDISFVGLDLPKYFDYHGRALAPYVSQPLIKQNSQWERYSVNWGQWYHCVSAKKRSFFVVSTMVEQQTAVLDGDFFSWLYGSSVMNEMIEAQTHMKSCWGIEHVWCGAARAYRDLIYSGQVLNWDADQYFRPPCALLFTPISHENSQSIPKSDAFRARGYYLNALAFNFTLNKPGGLTETNIKDVNWAISNGYKNMNRSDYPAVFNSHAADELGNWALHQLLLCKSKMKFIAKNNPWIYPLTKIPC